MKRGIAALVALAGFVVSARIEGSTLYSSGISAKLYQVSQVNGSGTAIGTMGSFTTRDLASDTRPGSYRLWTTSTAQELISIDPATGVGTSVGQFSPGGFLPMRTLAFDITTGKLYGADDAQTPKLYEIDPQTALATPVGNTAGVTQFLGGLGADLAGNLYGSTEASGEIFKLDKVTGAATLVMTVPEARISDLAFRPEDGQLFASTLPAGPSTTANALFAIDLGNGTWTRLGNLPGIVPESMNGLAFGPGTFVPEPGVGLALIAAIASLIRRRKF